MFLRSLGFLPPTYDALPSFFGALPDGSSLPALALSFSSGLGFQLLGQNWLICGGLSFSLVGEVHAAWGLTKRYRNPSVPNSLPRQMKYGKQPCSRPLNLKLERPQDQRRANTSTGCKGPEPTNGPWKFDVKLG